MGTKNRKFSKSKYTLALGERKIEIYDFNKHDHNSLIQKCKDMNNIPKRSDREH